MGGASIAQSYVKAAYGMPSGMANGEAKSRWLRVLSHLDVRPHTKHLLAVIGSTQLRAKRSYERGTAAKRAQPYHNALPTYGSTYR